MGELKIAGVDGTSAGLGIGGDCGVVAIGCSELDGGEELRTPTRTEAPSKPPARIPKIKFLCQFC